MKHIITIRCLLHIVHDIMCLHVLEYFDKKLLLVILMTFRTEI